MRRARISAQPAGPTLAARESSRSHTAPSPPARHAERALGNQATLRRLSHSAPVSGPIIRRDTPAPDATKKAAPASPAAAPAAGAGPAPSPTPDASKTEETKLTIPWDQILKGDTTLLQILTPGMQPPAAGGSGAPAPGATPAPAPAPAAKGPTAAGASPAGPAAPTAGPAGAGPAGAGPAAPSRLSLKDWGSLSLGLRLGFPDLGSSAGPDGSPSAVQQSIQTGEIINYSMTGKLPSAYQVDKGKLVGVCWSLFSTYIAPDVAAKIAKGMSGKSAGGGLSYELDGVLLPDFSGAGVSFTLRWGGGKAPRPSAPADSPAPVQPKLKVGSTSDPLEAEADQAADQVMRMTGSSSDEAIHRKCSACEEEDKKTVQPKSNDQSASAGAAPPLVHQVLNSGGQPLNSATRAFFEPRFGADFSGVRVHTDQAAAQSASSINASAYAAGKHIVLGPGASTSPSRLLAHELAHVVQQGAAPAKEDEIHRAPGKSPELSMPGFACEHDGNVSMCNFTKGSASGPLFEKCFAESRKIIDDCKGDKNDCLAHAKCAQCDCMGKETCICTGIV